MSALSNLRDLTSTECLRLLAAAEVGRVVYVDRAMPAIQPVNYTLVDNEVIYRTANGAKLAAATRNTVVAFEIDEIDACTRTGWSVVVIGRCHEVTDPNEITRLATRMPSPWVTNHTAHTIAINIERLSGRRITLSEGLTPDLFGA